MKKYKRFILVPLILCAAFTTPMIASALYDGGGGLSLGIRTDVSKDGTNWHNYTADENPGNETLVVKPGDTITLRGTVWNAGAVNTNVSLKSLITNSQYIDYIQAVEGADSNTDGTGAVYQVDGLSVTNNVTNINLSLQPWLSTVKDVHDPETGQIKVKLKNDIPDQTVIEETLQLESATPVNVQVMLTPVAIAQAQTLSKARIIVSNPILPGQGTPTLPTELPKTGASFGMETLVSLMALVGIIDGYLLIQRMRTVKARN